MGEERIELEKLTIVLFQSLAVLFSAYIVSFFKNAEYTPQTIAILYLLHFVVFYISNVSYRFYSRGYLDELFQVLKYNVFFAVGITFTSFMLCCTTAEKFEKDLLDHSDQSDGKSI